MPAFYSDNYVSLAPGETRTLTVEADAGEFHGSEAVVAIDGWNIAVTKTVAAGVTVELNEDAQVNHWPVTHLPFQTEGLRHQATDK